MNFDLPGTGTGWGFGLVLGTMVSASLLLFWRFRSLQWL
jgi:LPXTG-motif cell wall-anchored protein